MHKRTFRHALFLLAGILIGFLPAAWGRDQKLHFLILTEEASLTVVRAVLIENGGRVRQQVPPRILVVALPRDINPKEASSGIQTAYTGAVPVAVLRPLGPIAVAAGLQWNQTRLTRARSEGSRAFRSMAAEVSRVSLPSPTNIRATADGIRIQAEWDAVYGALLYDIQISRNADFRSLLSQTQTNRTSVSVAAPPSAASLYVRVRARDRSNADPSAPELLGAWSEPVPLSMAPVTPTPSLPAPRPTSPLNDFESEGFTVILEWLEHAGTGTRVQIAASDSFDAPLIDSLVDGREYVVPSAGLDLDGTYFWRIQAWGPQISPWSEGRRFHINPPRTVGSDTFINPELPQ